MKLKLLTVLCLSLISTVHAVEPSFTVVQRQPNSSRVYYSKVELKNLFSNDTFEGSYFKIVHSKNDEPISFNDPDKKLVRKAANVYFHLTKARDYWVEKVRSKRANSLPQMTVRLDITNLFDELGHFAHDNRSPQFNNALSVPEGETPEWVPGDRQRKWEQEIWFRPMKSILTSDLGPLPPNPLTQSLEAIERPLISYTQNQFRHSLMENIFYPNYVARPLHEDVIRMVGTIALTKIFIQSSKHADRLFIDKYYYLETAMIPEIVYHEYSHIILSDHLELSHSTPVNEGLADYFAASLAKKRKVYDKVRGFSNSAPKDTNNKRLYNHWDEANRFASADFTLSVLWDVREALGEEIGDQVVYEARKHLKTATATISDHLLRAILRACETHCEKPRRDRLKLLRTFTERGF